MLNTESCHEIGFIIESSWGHDVFFTPEEWIAQGPGPRYGHRPGPIYCFDDEPPRLIGLMPLMYRNNSLARFLIIMGVFEYPWTYSADVMKGIPTRLVLLEEDNERISKSISFTGAILMGWPQFKTQTPLAAPHWRVKPCKIFDHFHYLITNAVSLFGCTSKIAEELKELPSPDAFIMLVDPIVADIGDADDLLDYMADLTPDESLADEIATGHKKIGEFDTHFIIADASKFNLSILVFILIHPKHAIYDFRSAINFFALTKLGEANRLVTQLNELMEQNLPADE